MLVKGIHIQLKRSGSKQWGKATGPASDLVNLARQARTKVKSASGNQTAHVDLTFHQVDLAICRGAKVGKHEQSHQDL